MTELADQQAQEHQELVTDAVVETHETAPAEKQEAPKSIREGIEAAVKEARARDDKTGQFVKQDQKTEKVEAKPPAVEQVSETKPEQPVEAPKPAGTPPGGWSEESKKAFASLPPSVQADVLKREQEVSDGFKKYGETSKRYQEIDQVIAPHRANFQRFGIQSDAQAIQTLLAWENAVRSNPAVAIRQLSQSYGVDLSNPAQPSQQAVGGNEQQQWAQQQPMHDPRFDSVVQELNELKNGNIQREIAAFAQGKPHFDAVRELMGKLLNGGAASTMDEAYQTALKIHPEVSQLIAKEAADKAEAERKKAAEDKARAAAAAAASVRGSSPQGEVANSRKPQRQSSVRESLKAAIAEARA